MMGAERCSLMMSEGTMRQKLGLPPVPCPPDNVSLPFLQAAEKFLEATGNR